MSHMIGVLRMLAEEGGKTETPHSWLPEPYEIIWGSVATVVIAAALWKLALPQLRTALAARTERIQREIDASRLAVTDAQAAATRIRASKGDLQAERGRILAEADQTVDRVKIDGNARIAGEAADAQTRAESDIAIARLRVQAELQSDVAVIAASATDDVVRASLDGAAQQRLIEDFISKVGASR